MRPQGPVQGFLKSPQPVQGHIADKIGILSSYWLSIGLLAYVLFYALVLSKPVIREV